MDNRNATALFGAAVWLALPVSAACDQAPSHVALSDVELEEVLSVGLLDGDETRLFGRILDVRAASDGSFFILDSQTPAVRWFDLSGRHLGSIDQRGGGPGELSEPRAMAASSTGHLAIVDPRNARYGFYRFDEDGLSFERSIRTLSGSAASGKHLCTVGDRVFLRFLGDGKLIHELDSEGQVVASFQSAVSTSVENFGPAGTMVAAQRNSGHLLCIADQGLIVSVDRYSPRVQAFTLDGEQFWQMEVADFRPLEFVPVAGGGVMFKSHPEGSHLSESVVRWSPRSLVVQYSTTWPEGSSVAEREGDFFQLVSREISLSDGLEIGRSETLPLMLDIHDNFVYSATHLPFPRVEVLARER